MAKSTNILRLSPLGSRLLGLGNTTVTDVPDRVERRLAAVMAADVAGFSALMSRDDEGTFARLTTIRETIIEPTIKDHRGRLVKTTGDGFLIEFGSPVEAVRCAIAIQQGLEKAEVDREPGDVIQLRMGINLGDIIVGPDGDVYGDGVNVAARLESLSDPGGVLISGKIYDEIEGKIDAAFTNLGEQQVKNIARPVRVLALQSPGPTPMESVRRNLPIPSKPSIAVLPFTNMSRDPDQEYFSDGITEDLLTALAHIPWLFVIARNSSFVFKEKAVDVKEMGRLLGVRYVLEGSIRRVSHRVRITSQLIETTTGAHIWAARYDRDWAAIFELQDEITQSVVAAVEPSLRRAEIDRAKRRSPDELDAYDLYLRALAHLNVVRPDSRAKALELIDRALLLRPDYAEAHGIAAWCYFAQAISEGRLSEEAKGAMLRHARAVLLLQSGDATALAHAAIALAFVTRDYHSSLETVRRALSLNPSSVQAHGAGSILSAWVGDYDSSIELAERALRLSPLDPLIVMPLIGKAGALLMKSQFEAALGCTRQALQILPAHTPSFLISIACLVRLGRVSEAKAVASRLMELSPTFRVFQGMPILEHFYEELREAGLPD